jgi:hypothetical protein
VGAEARLECTVGRWLLPFDACSDLVRVPGLVGYAVTGDDAYRD